jgi:hypothetical protein
LSVEKGLDELWVGVKGQSNWEIARTLRNAFRSSLELIVIEVEPLFWLGGFTAYQTKANSECYDIYSGVRHRVLRSGAKRETTQTIS